MGGRLANLLLSGKYLILVITEIELLFYLNITSDKEVQIRDFLTKIIVVGIEVNIKELAIALRKQYKPRLPDAIIVATAKCFNATFLTNDVKLANLTKINTQSIQIV
ncbi:PIN domain-containing protein [Nostoc sp. PA-18-2419]|uniref:PIN domain-containing protein n=1 Tax=Nostoc sp. PA-18-2419 TaxID=2575443 RepID=UPI001CB968B3|nr:PIN domain-containing protein [Nostoc sp. PA-18-2419]